jgi:hypothetical protein
MEVEWSIVVIMFVPNFMKTGHSMQKLLEGREDSDKIS